MALDLDFGLMFCSREEFSFKNVYVNMLVGIKQLYTQKRLKQFRLKTPCLDDNVKSKKKRQHFKLCKPIYFSKSICQHSFVFSLFW